MSSDPYAPRLTWTERIRRANHSRDRRPPAFKSDAERLADLRRRFAPPNWRPFDGCYALDLPWNNELQS